MSRNRDRKDIERALQQKGFEKEERHHTYYFFRHNGLKQAVFTKVSRGSGYKVYDASLLGQMSTQLNLTNSQLTDLIDCPMDEEDYIKNLKNRGIIS